MKYIMGLDIGTTGCKVNVFDQEGNVCAHAYREYLNLQHDGLMDAEGVWERVCPVSYTHLPITRVPVITSRARLLKRLWRLPLTFS